MMYLSTIAACSALLATTVSAHGGVTSYSSGSTTWAGWSPYNGGSQVSVERRYDSYNPLLIADLSTDNIRCNNADITGTGQSATIAAGSQLTAYWLQWTHAQGCVMVYMAKCPSSGCNSFVGNGAVWFKIDQVGLISGTVYDGTWGPGLIEANLKYTVTIPASLPSGEYLIRHELLALHQANNPQFYPECAQLIVTGGGSGTPSPLVSLPGAYSGSDPAVNMNIYSNDAMTQTSYTCPGPAVWPATGGSTGGSTSSKTTTTAVKTTLSTVISSTKSTTTSIYTPPPSTTTSKSTTTTSASKTSSAAGAGQTLYGQCGGIGWTGPTTCASGTCKANGSYYSQCSP